VFQPCQVFFSVLTSKNYSGHVRMFSLRRPDILPVGSFVFMPLLNLTPLLTSLISVTLVSSEASSAGSVPPLSCQPYHAFPQKASQSTGNVSDNQNLSAPGDTSSTGNQESNDAVLPSRSLPTTELDVSSLPPVLVTPVKGKRRAEFLEE